MNCLDSYNFSCVIGFDWNLVLLGWLDHARRRCAVLPGGVTSASCS